MRGIVNLIGRVFIRIRNKLDSIEMENEKNRYGYLADSCLLHKPDVCGCPEKVFMYEDTHIYSGCKFIISPATDSGRFVMKRKAGAAQGLTVITNSHAIKPDIDKYMMDCAANKIGDTEQDVIVEEDVLIGANVTILPGVTVGRGSIIGAGSVIRKSIPPYAIVLGNPAKVVSFVYTPDEIIEHEKILYDESERLSYDYLCANYKRLFVNQIREISNFLK